MSSTLTNSEKRDLLEIPIWRTLQRQMINNLGDEIMTGSRQPYVRATFAGYGYTIMWNYPNTATIGHSRADFKILLEGIPLMNIEAHNINTHFKVSYSWHETNTLARFSGEPAQMGVLVTSCYNLTNPSKENILNSLQRYNVSVITLNRQILSIKDTKAHSQIEEALRPYLNRVFD